MIKHIVMWKFKEGEHDNMLIFRDRLLALKGQIPEIRAMEVGINMNPSDRSFDAVLRQRVRQPGGAEGVLH